MSVDKVLADIFSIDKILVDKMAVDEESLYIIL